jgi:DivIVA domain-containing protein
MTITPLDLEKARFAIKLRGYDPDEVAAFLKLAADELAAVLTESDRRERENRDLRERVGTAEERQNQLQEALLRGQRVAEEMVSAARQEARLLVKEAELTGDKIVGQSMEQVARMEARIAELRSARNEVQLKFKNTLDLYSRILEADMQEEEPRHATIHPHPRLRRS